MATKLSTYGIILKNTFTLFMRNDPLKLGGATAFFTLFALPPVITILVQLLSLFINPKTIRHEVFISLSGIFGKEAVQQIVAVIKAIKELNNNWLSAILLFLFLLLVATTVFRIIRVSINQIWDVQVQPEKKVIASLRARLLSLGVIVITAVLFSIAMLIETVQVLAGNYFTQLFPNAPGLPGNLLGLGISMLMIAVWFTIIFKYINNRHPSWRVAWAGGLFTSVLFSIGKFVLHLLLTYNNINNIYGASAAIVLLLLFVFYTAMMLYIGAAFTICRARILKQADEAGVSV